MDWFRDVFGMASGPVFPTLIRVRQPGGRPADQVRLSGTFQPGGQHIRKTLTTASGLCMIEWPADARSLRARLGAEEGTAEIVVDCRRPDPDRVIEVQLN